MFDLNIQDNPHVSEEPLTLAVTAKNLRMVQRNFLTKQKWRRKNDTDGYRGELPFIKPYTEAFYATSPCAAQNWATPCSKHFTNINALHHQEKPYEVSVHFPDDETGPQVVMECAWDHSVCLFLTGS